MDPRKQVGAVTQVINPDRAWVYNIGEKRSEKNAVFPPESLQPESRVPMEEVLSSTICLLIGSHAAGMRRDGEGDERRGAQ